MRHILSAILLIFSFIAADAQKNNFFGDIGRNSTGNAIPGGSFTYSRKVAKHWGLGAGVQAYDYAQTDLSRKKIHQFIPTVYADLRAYVPIKRSLLFFIGDLGLSIYRSRNNMSIYEMPHSNSAYLGLGMGYHYRITKRGLGPYISLKMANNIYSARQITPQTTEVSRVFALDGALVLSLGVKF